MSEASSRPQGAPEGLGAALRRARLRRGLSLRRLALLLDVSPATLSAVENGHRSMSPTRIAQAAEILETSSDDLQPSTAEQAGVGSGPEATGTSEASTGTAAAVDWRHYPPLELDPPLAAALEAFSEFGYHGATMRDVARRAALSVPGVYHYYGSKQDMLVAILDVTMADLRARSTAARAEGDGSVERFALLVECLALFHTHRRELGFVGASEMRSLVPEHRARVAAARRGQQRMVDEEVERACEEGLFLVPHAHQAARAVVTMCTALPQWFDERGPATAEEVASQYVVFALDMMRCTPLGRRRIGARR